MVNEQVKQILLVCLIFTSCFIVLALGQTELSFTSKKLLEYVSI